jgi:hypothetical protein
MAGFQSPACKNAEDTDHNQGATTMTTTTFPRWSYTISLHFVTTEGRTTVKTQDGVKRGSDTAMRRFLAQAEAAMKAEIGPVQHYINTGVTYREV